VKLNIMAGGYAEKKERDFNRERRRSDREESSQTRLLRGGPARCTPGASWGELAD